MKGADGGPLTIPEIRTDRLRLRAHVMADFAKSAAMWANPDVTRYIRVQPFSEEETWARFLRYAGHWSVMGFGFWAVEETATGEFVGEVGFAHFKREIQPPMGDTPELGWVLAPQAHGKGHATEAVRAALEWGTTHLASPSTVCLIHPENTASIRVADKCGFRKFCLTTYKGQPSALYRRPLQMPSGVRR